jgi:hypothetical protein
MCQGRAMCEARLIRAALGDSDVYAACVAGRPVPTCTQGRRQEVDAQVSEQVQAM